LAVSFVIVMLVGPFRQFFNLYPLPLREIAIVAAAVASWAVLVWIFWRFRFVDRFLGVEEDEPGSGTKST
jgi:cation-transporting ATPase E